MADRVPTSLMRCKRCLRSNQRVSFLLSLPRVIRKRRGIFPIPLVKERWYIGEGATCVIGNLY